MGCLYCYARYTHGFLGHDDPAEFEQTIYVKRTDPSSLLTSLRRARASGFQVAIGTATDPYQPAEARFLVTRQILEAARLVPGLRLGITTKSPLVTRDLNLLQEISRGSALWVNFSVITLDTDLARRLEPRAPRPDLRLRAMRILAGAGIRTRLFVMPVVPGLTDGVGTLERLLAAAQDAGCREVRWNMLFLRTGTRETFLRLIKREFPWLFPRYRSLYARSAYVPPAYRDEVQRRIEDLARAAGLPLCAREDEGDSSGHRQLALAWQA